MQDDDSRYAEIMRRLAARKAKQVAAQSHDDLARILDALDAWGKVERMAKAKALRGRCWGPKDIRGLAPAAWVGVMGWHRAPGYHGYKTLTLWGVWAVAEAETPLVVVGAKHVAYSAPFYEAEAYHKLMRRGFSTYYTDDGSPPSPASRRLSIPYDPAARLALRDTVRDALSECI
jgi:hypothetical protein